MRWVALVVVLALVVGCKDREVGPNGGPGSNEPGFDENSIEKTLAWLAAQKNALDATVKPGDEAATNAAREKLKTVAESMKGRSISWPLELAEALPDRTGVLVGHKMETAPPEPKGEGTEARARSYAIVCKPFEPDRPIREGDPFVRKPEKGFPTDPPKAEWIRGAKPGSPVKLTGTIEAVQLHSSSSRIFGINQQQIINTEIAFTIHVAGGSVTQRAQGK